MFQACVISWVQKELGQCVWGGVRGHWALKSSLWMAMLGSLSAQHHPLQHSCITVARGHLPSLGADFPFTAILNPTRSNSGPPCVALTASYS